MNQTSRIRTGSPCWIAAWRSRINHVTSMRLRHAAGKGIDWQKIGVLDVRLDSVEPTHVVSVDRRTGP